MSSTAANSVTPLIVTTNFQSAASISSSKISGFDPDTSTSDVRSVKSSSGYGAVGATRESKQFPEYPRKTGARSVHKKPKRSVKILLDTFDTPESAISKLAVSNKQNRHCLSESYEKPKSCREGWWRATVRETPNPGHYESEYFLEELHRRPATYQFKSEGRKQDAQRYNRGAVLLPGAYNTQQDMSDRLEKSIQRYTFLDTDRSKQNFIMGCRDKEINVAPNAYRTEDHLAVRTEKLPSKDAAFKSQTARFPTKYFKPKEGPAPGMYEPNSPYPPRAISSSFISRTPRFKTSHTKVPGPGSYEKTLQYPQPAPVVEMGRDHGIFFTSDYRL